MTKIISLQEDKKFNKWHPEVEKVLVDKSIKPRDLTLESPRLEIICEEHGVTLKTIVNIYKNIKEHGKVVCNKCSRATATKKAMATNLERFGGQPAQNPAVLEKMKKTNLERYGTEFIVQMDDYHDKVKKTNLEKYGVEYGLMDPEIRAKGMKTMEEKYGEGNTHYFKSKENYENWKKGNVEKFGVEFPMQNEEVREKFTETMKERYGVDHALQHEEFLEKAQGTTFQNYGVNHPTKSYEVYLRGCETKNEDPVSEESFNIVNNKELFIEFINQMTIKLDKKPTIVDIANELKYGLTAIGFSIRGFELQDMIRYLGGESYGEHELLDFFKRNGISAKHRYTKLGPELDIYIEKYDLGIEYTGLYWHSDIYKKKNYHYDKYKYYNDIGTRVIHIYEDEWNDMFTQDIIKAIILSACGKVKNNHMKYARKLDLVELDNSPDNIEKIKNFLDSNHLQGFRPSSIYLALMENDNIIELMTFGHPFFGNKNAKNYQYELIRHCTKLHYSVVGGKERLFKYFLDNYPHDNQFYNHIVTYADIDKFNGNSYLSLGFKLFNHSIPVWGLEENFTKRISRNPNNNAYFKTLPKIYGAGNNTYVY